MAKSTRLLCCSIRQILRDAPIPRGTTQCRRQIPIRSFSSAPIRRADDPASNPTHATATAAASRHTAKQNNDNSGNVLHESEYLTPQKPYTVSDLSPSERADYDMYSKEEQKTYMKLQNHFKAMFESSEFQGDLDSMADQADREIEREGGFNVSLDFNTARAKGGEVGYWAEDEDDEFGQMEDGDDDFSEEHITTVAESQLDLHRDIREYTRAAAWDLPLLQQYAKPFQLPNQSTPLRFRYTTYMGEHHPAQHKVVVEFCSKDLLANPSATYKLTEPQRLKLLKLVGVRYNPDTDLIKMSCEKFNSAAQNKRYLGDLITNLIKEAKDKRDMFDDVALDLRHHKQKKNVVYPESWKMGGKTVQKVLEARKEMKLLGGGEEAVPVDGQFLVEQYVRAGNVTPSKLMPR